MLLTNEEYIQNDGNTCPNCRHKDSIEMGDLDAGCDEAWNNCKCTNCNATWVDVYQLTGYCDLIIP